MVVYNGSGVAVGSVACSAVERSDSQMTPADAFVTQLSGAFRWQCPDCNQFTEINETHYCPQKRPLSMQTIWMTKTPVERQTEAMEKMVEILDRMAFILEGLAIRVRNQ